MVDCERRVCGTSWSHRRRGESRDSGVPDGFDSHRTCRGPALLEESFERHMLRPLATERRAVAQPMRVAIDIDS
jgi:hypothetical protein